MDMWSWSALVLLFLASGIVFWGLLSPTHALPKWAHKHDKCWHLLAFLGLAILAQGAWMEVSGWSIWLVLLVSSIATEWMQEKWAPGRLFSWADAFYNALGASLGIAISVPLWEIVRT